MNRVMVVEDDQALAETARIYLERRGWEVSVFRSVEEAVPGMEALRPDVIVADYLLPGKTGLDLLREATAMDPQVKVVMTTGHGDIQLAVEAMKNGAYDYLCKPLVLAELKLLLDRAMGTARMEKTLTVYRRSQARGSGLDAMLGDSPGIGAIKERIRQILEMETVMTEGVPPSVLITGETGTGKELVARALHFDGPRRDGPFIELNCASLPVHLLESELFGHERGAFTDAKERKVGLVEAAEGGTLFLDEIGEVDLTIQAKLLKLLEERRVRRVGSTRERKVDVRIVSATNRDLEKMVREERFRADLYFRLRILNLHVPPLRDRREDVLLLARHFLAMHGVRYGKRGLQFTEGAECALLAHSWPGNVRELQNLLEQTVLLAHGDSIGCEDITITPVFEESVTPSFHDVDGSPIAIPGGCVKLNDVERQLIAQALAENDWNVSKAAQKLGITRDKLRTRMERYRLARPER